MFTTIRKIGSRLLMAEIIAVGSSLIAVAFLTLLGLPELMAIGLAGAVRCAVWFAVICK